MASPYTKGYGVKVDGLAESIRALKKLDPAYRKEAVGIFRTSAQEVQVKAQRSIGHVGRYPKRKGMIGRSATGTGAAVKLRAKKYPWALSAEYGEVVADVYGVPYPQEAFKRRTMGIWRPPTSQDMFKNKGGYMVQPVLRAMLPKITKQASDDLTDLIDRAMRKAKVPRGR